MAKKSTEAMVGAFVVLGLAGFIFLALKAANLASFGSAQTYKLSARFDNIGSLKVRAPVRSAGVSIGHVTAISLDAKTYQGLVSMEIKEGVEFPRDSSAKILTAGVLGDQYIGIEPGSDDKNIGPGEVIKQTQSAVVLEDLLGRLIFNKAADAGSAGGAQK